MSLSPAAEIADGVMQALLLPLETGEVSCPLDAPVLVLGARDSFRLRQRANDRWLCQQSFKPFADALIHAGMHVGEPAPTDRYALVLVLPPRQREQARAVFARALQHALQGGRVLAALANAEGAKSAEHDLAQLAPLQGRLAKHKCRVFWTASLRDLPNPALTSVWLAHDGLRENAAGYVSRAGLFAWDRVDAASALLAASLPDDLAGSVADLGAGYGYLSSQLVKYAPRLERIDLYEAEARALAAADQNMQRAIARSGQALTYSVQWRDVTQGLPRQYDVIVSNPPFHQGRADQPELGRAFIASAAHALTASGRLFLVANRHLPYEATLRDHFGDVRVVTEHDGFKVIAASGVRR